MAIIAREQSFTLDQGDDRTLRFPVVDEDDAPVNLTGFQAAFGLAKRGFPAAQLTSAAGDISIASDAATNDALDVRFQHDVTDDLFGEYEFQLKVIDPTGNEVTVARGTLTFAPKVTGE